MKGSLLSIIVLNWNRLKYSSQTIENVLAKTSLPHELILVDNNSADESLRDYLSKVKGNKSTQDIKLVFNSRNLGTGGGRNSGSAKARGDYIIHLDDDVLVPDEYDNLMVEVCDKVPKLGQTGVNVEVVDYPVSIINGVKYCPKIGNLGEACTCMTRKTFNIMGYFNYFNTYGHEGAAFYMRLQHIGLISAYIEPRGVHIDQEENKEYRARKDKAFLKTSLQMQEFYAYVRKMRATNNVYVPWTENYKCGDEKTFCNDIMVGKCQK